MAGSGTTGNPVAREYDDGFVRVDNSDNAGGYTWYWGYQNDTQLEGVGTATGGTLLMHSTVAATSTGRLQRTEDVQHGAELVWQHELGRNDKVRMGAELAFGVTYLDVAASRTAPVQLTRIVDAYPLEGMTPPLAPYAGTFAGPGPLLRDEPTRTTDTVAGWSTSNTRKIDGQLYGLRFGPYLELPVTEWLGVLVSGGFAGGYADAEFSYSDRLTDNSGVVRSAQRGSRSRAYFLTGAYLEGMLNFAVSPRVSVFAGAQWQWVESWEATAGDRHAKLDFTKAVFVSGGVSIAF